MSLIELDDLHDKEDTRMKKTRVCFLLFLSFVLIVVPYSVSGPQIVHAERNGKDLIFYENVPDIDRKPESGYQLSVLRVYRDGHFEKAEKNLNWKTTNKKVAAVDNAGKITLTGKVGKATISVSDGNYTDRISIQYRGGHKSKEPVFKKEKGKRYQIIEQAIKEMTIEEKVGQMLMPDFRTWNGENVTELSPEIEQLVKKYHLGGVILFRENVVSTEQTVKLVSAYEEASEKYGLLMTIDQEGGIVTRLQSGTNMPGNMALGAARSAELAEKTGRAIGEELHSLGINMNFAPVMDINNNPDNPVIGVRSFGESPELVAEMGVAYMKGLQAAGVAATAKHFPGHGDTAVDSHLGLPEVPHDRERLNNIELFPFQKGMEAGIDAIMTAHVTFPKIDDTKVISQKTGEEISLPATLSYKVLTELMRKEMGYKGVITTDAMNMNAIAEHFGPVDAAVRAVKAGADIVLMPVGLGEVADGLVQAVKAKEISVKRIEASVERILTLKLKRGIIKEEVPLSINKKISAALNTVGSEAHKQVEKEAAEQSITLLKNNDVLPLEVPDQKEVAVLGRVYVQDLAKAVQSFHPNVTVVEAPEDYKLTAEQKQKLTNADAVIIGSVTSNVAGRMPENPQMAMIKQVIAETDAPVITLAVRNPYDIAAFPEVDAYLAQYGFQSASFRAAAAVIFGHLQPAGKLPVTIPDDNGQIMYNYGFGLGY